MEISNGLLQTVLLNLTFMENDLVDGKSTGMTITEMQVLLLI